MTTATSIDGALSSAAWTGSAITSSDDMHRIAALQFVTTITTMQTLPGVNLIRRGIADLDTGRESAEVLLVSIGAPRLCSLGIDLPAPIASPAHKLYRLLVARRVTQPIPLTTP